MSDEKAGAGIGSPATARPNEEAVIEEVRRALRGIEFGSVLIKLHQGQVVGIETSTKVRLKSTWGHDHLSARPDAPEAGILGEARLAGRDERSHGNE
jgi:hypothetical protein